MLLDLNTQDWKNLLSALDEAKDNMMVMQRKCLIHEDEIIQKEYKRQEDSFIELRTNILNQIEKGLQNA